MTADRLLRRLITLCRQEGGVGLGAIELSHVDALLDLQRQGKVIVTTDTPAMVWVHPDAIKDRRRRARAEKTYVESDLPRDVDLLKHLPDRDSQPPVGQRRNGEPIYRSRDEPSELVAMGPTPWPPDGTEIHARRYREPRAVYTEVSVSDIYVTADACPVCGKADTRGRKQTSNNINCLCCDLWAKNVTDAISTLETPPEVVIEPKKRRKAG